MSWRRSLPPSPHWCSEARQTPSSSCPSSRCTLTQKHFLPCAHPLLQWGTPGAFPQLSVLSLDRNNLSGTLPEIWGAPQAMTLLQEL